MKAVILAGGYGTRISEESHLKPKPMIEIGGKPILWHIMKIYSSYGINDFIICCGYKAEIIKKYFAHNNVSSLGNMIWWQIPSRMNKKIINSDTKIFWIKRANNNI